MESITSLLKPIITERSLSQAKKGLYTCVAKRNTRKESLKKTIQKLINVNVEKIQTSTITGKTRRVGKYQKKTKVLTWKKVIIKLKKDQKIALFDIGK